MPQAFAQDPVALALAQHAVAAGADLELTVQHRAFLYMPYMHSESTSTSRPQRTDLNEPTVFA